jgi:hypothetical protein
MNKLFKLFSDHPKSVNESYLRHMAAAGYYGFKMIFAGFACVVHAVFPFIFESSASDCAKEINEAVEKRKQ